MADTIALLAVNVAVPGPVGERRGEVVLSAIAKRPVAPGSTLGAGGTSAGA